LEETWDIDATIQRAQKDEGATRKVRDADFVDKVKKMVDNDPNTSMRALPRHLNVSEGTVRLCVYEDMRCSSYKMQVGQILTQKAKDNRLLRSTRLLKKLKHP